MHYLFWYLGLYLANNAVCVTSCQSQTFANSITAKCERCEEGCEICSVNKTNCQRCITIPQQPRYLYMGRCLSDCPQWVNIKTNIVEIYLVVYWYSSKVPELFNVIQDILTVYTMTTPRKSGCCTSLNSTDNSKSWAWSELGGQCSIVPLLKKTYSINLRTILAGFQVNTIRNLDRGHEGRRSK